MNRLGATLAVLLALLCASVTSAQPSAKPPSKASLAEAKRLFRSGARAYDAGQFAAAVQAFDQAYELSGRVALRFSAAQALKRQYTLDGDHDLLKKARRYYRAYLDAKKQGKRVKDAVEGLGEVELILKTLEPEPPPPSGEGGGKPVAPPPPPPKAQPTKGTLHVDSDIEGSTAIVVGPAGRRELSELPQWLEVLPGSYAVTIRASGYDQGARTVRVDAGRISLADPPLRERPARVRNVVEEQADVIVDGRPMGRAPIAFELPSGAHRIAVGEDGYDVFAAELDLARDEDRTLAPELSMTGKRIAAWTLFAVGATSGVAGVGLAVAAAREQVFAREISDRSDPARNDTPRALSVAERDEYNGHISTRDNFTRFAGGAFALGFVSAGIGLLLYTLDEPNLYGAFATLDEPKGDDEASPPPVELDGAFVPLLEGPEPGGALILRGRF